MHLLVPYERKYPSIMRWGKGIDSIRRSGKAEGEGGEGLFTRKRVMADGMHRERWEGEGKRDVNQVE